MAEQSATAGQGKFIDELFSIMKRDGFRDPMLDSVRSGRMSRAGLRLWATQAALVVREFTRFISAIHANCPQRDAQMLLAENLWEEHGRGLEARDHFSLVKKMAKSLGVSADDIERAVPLPETGDYIAHCFKVCREGSFIESMTAIGVGIEYYMPGFFGAFAEALCARYGLERGDVEYLLVHVGEDEEHAQRAIELIERYADTEESREKARQALRDMLGTKRRFAEALYARCSDAV